jgi:hypothetical protein
MSASCGGAGPRGVPDSEWVVVSAVGLMMTARLLSDDPCTPPQTPSPPLRHVGLGASASAVQGPIAGLAPRRRDIRPVLRHRPALPPPRSLSDRTPSSQVRLNWNSTGDMGRERDARLRASEGVRHRVGNGRRPVLQPSSTLLGVGRLALPELLIDIEATAVKCSRCRSESRDPTHASGRDTRV